MSSEVHKYIETALDSKKDLFEAEVIDFPNNKKIEDYDNWQPDNNFGSLLLFLIKNLIIYFPICRKSYIIYLNTTSFLFNFFLLHPMPSIRSTSK